MKTSTGRLITLEGGEGAGKSTQARFVVDWLRARGRTVVQTREPGGSPLAEKIRGLVLERWPDEMSLHAETLLMFAARAAHWQGLIAPALARGEDVVCDRFTDSTYAYQGAGKGLPVRDIAALEKMVLGRARPQLTLVLDVKPETGLARAKSRGDANRFEDETLAFARRVRACFLARAKAAPARYAVLNANRDAGAVTRALTKLLEQRL